MNFLKRKSTKYILLALLVIGASSAIYAYKEYNRTAKDIASITPDFSISSNAIITEFVNNDTASVKKYTDKALEIKGIIKTIDKDENGAFTLVFSDTTNNTSVRCSMDSVHNSEASILKEGVAIQVKGICTGFNKDELGLGSDIILNHTCISKN
ncbi:MAG: hypothetical protein ABL929_11275 [Ferruginibacter sp.]|nr:hypothetical protein [Ferruginibacter sp.]